VAGRRNPDLPLRIGDRIQRNAVGDSGAELKRLPVGSI